MFWKRHGELRLHRRVMRRGPFAGACLGMLHDERSQGEKVEMADSERPQRVLRRTDDGFLMNVETRIDDTRDSGLAPEAFKYPVIVLVVFFADDLWPRRIVDVNNAATLLSHALGTAESNGHIASRLAGALKTHEAFVGVFS